MSCKLIDGKAVAAKIKQNLKRQVAELKEQGAVPGLAVVLVGQDPASHIYVNNKEKACQEVGLKSEVLRLPATTTETELLAVVEQLNRRADIHGILVQLPLPGDLREEKIIAAIDPHKDVDGFHPLNMGKLLIGRPGLIPCTPRGCMKLIAETGYDLTGKRAVVVGRSNIVGKPMAALLLQANATVTVCHSRTKDLAAVTREADVLVVAIGKADFITGSMVKSGALVLDVGMNRLENGKLTGDVEFASVSQTAGWLTPVPGGVGPMTIAMLLSNTVEAFKNGTEQ